MTANAPPLAPHKPHALFERAPFTVAPYRPSPQELERRAKTLDFSRRIGRSDYKEMAGADCAKHERTAKALNTFIDALAAEFGVQDRAWLFAVLAEVAADETRTRPNVAVLDHLNDLSGRADNCARI